MPFGFYSEKQRAQTGYAYYKKPDGMPITITHISNSMSHGTMWDDIQYMGEVTEMVQSFWYGTAHENAESIVATKDPATDPEFPAAVPKVCPYRYYGVRPCTCGQCRCPPDHLFDDPFGYGVEKRYLEYVGDDLPKKKQRV